MKLSTLSLVAASVVTTCAAFPAPFPNSTHVPVSQHPSPPRPFPAGQVVEVKDPSPPRPFPVGHPVDVSPPREERAPSMPHMLVKTGAATTGPSLPTLSKYPLDRENTRDDGKLLEKRGPLSRFPNGGNQEAADPSPPRPFPAGPVPVVRHHGEGRNNGANKPSPPSPFPAVRLVEAQTASPNDTLSARSPSPLLRTVNGSAAEASDPSPPRPFPAGPVPVVRYHGEGHNPALRLVEAQTASPNDTLSARSPSPLLRTVNGSAAEASDPSPPRPFPAGHVVDVEPRGEMAPPSHAHGGYFPPSNPPVEQRAARLRKPCAHRCHPYMVNCCNRLSADEVTPWNSTTATPRADSIPLHTSSASSSSSLHKGHGTLRTVYTTARSTVTSLSVASASSSVSSALSASASSVSNLGTSSTPSTPSRFTTIATITSTSTLTATSTSTSTAIITSTSTTIITPSTTHTFHPRTPNHRPHHDILSHDTIQTRTGQC